MNTETRPSMSTVAHRVWLQIPEVISGKTATKRQIAAEIKKHDDENAVGWDFTAAEIGAAIKHLRDEGKIGHPTVAESSKWVRTSGHVTITRSKLYRSRLATGPGYAWSWCYRYQDQAAEVGTEFGTHLASLLDYLARKHPTRRIVKVWEAPAFTKCEHAECRADFLAYWISTGIPDPLCRVEEAEEDIDLALREAAHDADRGV